MSFLPCTVAQLRVAMERRLGDDEAKRTELRDFADSMSCAVGLFYDRMSQRIRERLHQRSAFDAEARDEFLCDLLTLLARAQYVPISDAEYADAMSGSFTFKFPTDVDWAKIDAAPLSEFYRKRYHASRTSVPPPRHTASSDFGDRLLILTRGRGVASETDRFVDGKLNLLCEVLLSKAMRFLGRKGAGVEAQRNVEGRVSLCDHVARHGILNSLLTPFTIKEPLFEDVVVVYWPKDPKAAAAKGNTETQQTGQQLRNRKEKTARQSSRRSDKLENGVVVDSFADVPLGDLEGVFPAKSVSLRPFDFVQVAVYVAMAGVVVAMTLSELLSSEQSDGTAVLLYLFLGEVVRQLNVLHYTYTNLKVAYMREIHQWEQAHNKAKGLAVVSQLVDDVKDQELKELLLAYYVLWVNGPQTSADVDRLAEEFLSEQFGVGLDFDVDDAVAKLESLEAVRRDASGRYTLLVSPAEWVAKYPVTHLRSLKLFSS